MDTENILKTIINSRDFTEKKVTGETIPWLGADEKDVIGRYFFRRINISRERVCVVRSERKNPFEIMFMHMTDTYLRWNLIIEEWIYHYDGGDVVTCYGLPDQKIVVPLDEEMTLKSLEERIRICFPPHMRDKISL
ncbi:MAG: hypothetical protein WC682_02335 [Parcubacteria group bacterium]